MAGLNFSWRSQMLVSCQTSADHKTRVQLRTREQDELVEYQPDSWNGVRKLIVPRRRDAAAMAMNLYS